MWEQVNRINKGVFVTTASQPFTSKLIMSNIKDFKEELIWEKERPSNIFLMRKRAVKCHENIIVFMDGVYNPGSTQNCKKRKRETMQKYVSNKWNDH